ncbi:hypothetical protein O1M54_00380 [Streptomyces diastatochromogenes]|nr:hypothetical protein [Streptomyces diastatochromogenes]
MFAAQSGDDLRAIRFGEPRVTGQDVQVGAYAHQRGAQFVGGGRRERAGRVQGLGGAGGLLVVAGQHGAYGGGQFVDLGDTGPLQRQAHAIGARVQPGGTAGQPAQRRGGTRGRPQASRPDRGCEHSGDQHPAPDQPLLSAVGGVRREHPPGAGGERRAPGGPAPASWRHLRAR